MVRRGTVRRRALMVIEAALVFPLLLMVTFLLLQYGWLFLKAEQIANAARHGARRAIVADATEAQVQNEVNQLLTKAGITSSVTTTISPSLEVDKGKLISVTVVVSVPNNPQMDLLRTGWLPLPSQLSSSVSMAKERS